MTDPNSNPTRCTRTTSEGTRCRAWAVRGSEPPTCAVHSHPTNTLPAAIEYALDQISQERATQL